MPSASGTEGGDAARPSVVRFTGLTLDPSSLLDARVLAGPIPPQWTRLRFQANHAGALAKLDRWLAGRIEGRWASYAVPIRFGEHVVVVAFERDADAVLFRLHGGEAAWAEALPD